MKAQKLVRVGLFGILGVLSLGAVLWAQAQEQSAEQASTPQSAPVNPQDPRYRLAVEVELVNLIATVLDDGGKYVEGLTMNDFQVLENGQPQKISFFSHDLRVPISVGALIDASGSMRHKLQQALQTVREISLALSPQDEMFVVSFDSDVTVRQRFTQNKQDIQRALREIRASGETAAYDAIQVGLNEMRSARHTKKILLYVTDGFDTKSRINAGQVEELLKRSEVLVYAIGIDDDDNDPLALRRTRYHVYHYMLNRLVEFGGGRAFRLFTGRNYALQSLATVLLEELHQQYTLSYYPSLAGGTDWRNVEVKVLKPGSRIRHRTGYYLTQASN
jgi:Ca-activated chloride channel family protein